MCPSLQISYFTGSFSPHVWGGSPLSLAKLQIVLVLELPALGSGMTVKPVSVSHWPYENRFQFPEYECQLFFSNVGVVTKELPWASAAARICLPPDSPPLCAPTILPPTSADQLPSANCEQRIYSHVGTIRNFQTPCTFWSIWFS